MASKDQPMNDLDRSERELVALGAAMGSNCVPCIEYHIPEAKKAGLTDLQVSAAIRLADKVRQVPARKVLDAASRMLGPTPADNEAANSDAACGHAAAATSTEGPCCT